MNEPTTHEQLRAEGAELEQTYRRLAQRHAEVEEHAAEVHDEAALVHEQLGEAALLDPAAVRAHAQDSRDRAVIEREIAAGDDAESPAETSDPA